MAILTERGQWANATVTERGERVFANGLDERGRRVFGLAIGGGTNATVTAIAAASTTTAIAPSVSADVSVTAVAASASASANAPFVGQVTQIIAVAAAASAQAIVPSITTQQNAVILSVAAAMTAAMRGAYANVTLIIGTIKLKGERQLTISLKGERQLTFKLKGEVPVAKEGQNFTMYAGNSETLEITATDRNTKLAIPLSGATIKWVMKKGLNGDLVIEKTTDSGVTITDANNGIFTVSLNPLDTDGKPGGYYHEAQVTDSQGNVSTVSVGSANIKPKGITI